MRVAVAVILDDKQRILITRRPLDAPHGGMWEFPGGKLEDDETPLAALEREVKEEVGLNVISADFLGQINHTYAHHSVILLVYGVHTFHGHAVCCEKQMDLKWVGMENLDDYEFPEANQQIIALIHQSF